MILWNLYTTLTCETDFLKIIFNYEVQAAFIVSKNNQKNEKIFILKE